MRLSSQSHYHTIITGRPNGDPQREDRMLAAVWVLIEAVAFSTS
jgi:hypothetical protein